MKRRNQCDNARCRFTPDTYEQMSNFAARLPREGGFLKRVFDGKVRSVLDCGCGPGHHAAMLADWGLTVLGIDASPNMIRRAKELYGGRARLGFRRLRFAQLDRIKQRFDAIICMGNSLLLSGTAPQVAATLKRMGQRLNPGGKMVLHVLNLQGYPINRLQVRSTHRVQAEGRTWLFVKLIEREAGQARMRIIWVDPTAELPGRCASERMFPVLDRQWFKQSLARAGLGKVRLYGGFDGVAYRGRSSPDMIVTGEKP